MQDPDAVLAAVAAALGECVSRLDGAEVVAVSVATAMHGLLGLDPCCGPGPARDVGRPPAADEARALRAGGGDELYRLTGVPVHPMTPLTKLRWFARHDAATWAAVSWWVGLKDWVLLWLTGELRDRALVGGRHRHARPPHRRLEPGRAGRRRRRRRAARRPCCPRPPSGRWPRGRHPGRAARRDARGGGRGRRPSANLGCGALGPAWRACRSAPAVRCAWRSTRRCPDAAGTLFCYPLTDSVWVAGGPISNGGNVVRWAGRSLAPDLVGAAAAGEGDDALLALAATAPPGCEGLVMVPTSSPSGRPRGIPTCRRRSWVCVPPTRAYLARAASRACASTWRWCSISSTGWPRCGRCAPPAGPSRAAARREVAGALLDRPLQVLDGVEGTALGAAALGVFALGREATLDAALASLCDLDAHLGPAEAPTPELLATYRTLRSSVPGLIAGLGRLAVLR